MTGQWMGVVGIVMGAALAPLSAQAETTCYGEGEYQVCTTVTTHADGSIDVRSSDTMGNTYESSTDVYTAPDGDITVTSRDSLGNRYQVDSWADSVGGHSADSLGNGCTVTYSGEMIGC